MKARDLLLAALMTCAACSTPMDAGVERNEGFRIFPGSFAAGRSPDGNTVVLDGRTGVIVFDTGRNASHADRIIAYAKGRKRPVVAIINSHWHLDHISGNPALREAFPGAAVYSHEPALAEALAGFLAKGAQSNRDRLAEGKLNEGQRLDAQRDLATYKARDRLHPTISLETSRRLTIDGRTLDIHIAKGASAGDIWVYDRRSGLAILGDLVTLPAPFLDTACPAEWLKALDEVLAQPFVSVAPGHGRMMARADLRLYRDAFVELLECASSSSAAASCADRWSKAAGPLLDESSGDIGQARTYASYYVERVLRKPDARPAWCSP